MDTGYGRRVYDQSHLPGAIYAHLDDDLSGPIIAGKTGRHPLPDRQAFVRAVQSWGISNDDQVVVYDDNTGAVAARLWWMFRWLGHERVAVLNGGFDAWLEQEQPVSGEVPGVAPTEFVAGEPLTRTISAVDIASHQGPVTDAREPARFRGDSEPIDKVAGHIPGASNLPFAGNMQDGKIAPADQLKQHFARSGLTEQDDIVCYCGSGVTAAHNILALRLAGYPEPRLYPGSWSEWITDPGRQIAVGD